MRIGFIVLLFVGRMLLNHANLRPVDAIGEIDAVVGASITRCSLIGHCHGEIGGGSCNLRAGRLQTKPIVAVHIGDRLLLI
jgi:hypothetical protein